MAHDEYGPSQAHRRVACPGSVRMERQARAAGISGDTDEADEGTRMHLANNPSYPLDEFSEEQKFQIEKARKYIGEKLQGAGIVHYEESMTLIADEGMVTHGTCDVFGVYPDHVRVIDIKYGRSLMSVSSGDWQMKLYAAMAMQRCIYKRAEVWVYQPREDTDFVAVYTDPLKIADEYADVIARCEAADAPCRPSPDACQWCLGKTICPAFQESLLTLPATRPALEMLDPTKLAKALDFAKLVEPWAKQVRDHARKLALTGIAIPGWKLGERTNRQVSNVNEAFAAVGDCMSQEAFLALADVPIGALEDAYARKWRDVNQNGVSLKDGIARFRERMAGAITTTTQRYLKKE